MSLLHPRRRGLHSLAVATLCFAGSASALTLQTVVAPIYQVGNGAQVNIGHTVLASTNYNRLTAGGSYSAVCAAPDVLPATGQRYLSTSNVLGGLKLTVTIPEWHPALISMPGYYAAATRGQTLNCTYSWVSRAVEGGYTVGTGGISFQVGNGEYSDGGTQPFIMTVPSLGDPNGWTSCIP
jgi:hypothetical protein